MQVPDRFYRKFEGADPKLKATDPSLEETGHTRAALAMCENIDWNVGRVLAKLQEWNLAEDTIVLYFSDNGPNGWRWNGGMKGRKGSVDEGGIRSPLLVRYPKRIKPGTRVSKIAGAIDLLPTLSAMTGVKFAPPKPLDGVDLTPLFTGGGSNWPDRMIFSRWARRASVRTQRYRLDNEGRLFDMIADPDQKTDIAAAQPAEAERLKSALLAWSKEMEAHVGKDTRAYPVGYGKTTWLPARDGEAHGGVKRSSGAPNDSYFTKWTSTQDSITWDVEVLNAGWYTAEIHYTCSAEDVGSTIELSLNGASTNAKILTAHDPPLVGAKEDRHDRGQESFVKDFKPLRLGKINLAKGRGPLTLRAATVAGRTVADLKYVVLMRE